jgi:hypothetical protein
VNHSTEAFCFFFLLTWLHIANASTVPPRNTDYAVHQKIHLTKRINGVSGSLEIWRDKRLTDSDLKLMQEHDPDDDSTFLLQFKKIPLKSALIALVSDDQQIIQTLPLEKTYANIKEKIIGKTRKQIFLITEDFGIGFGSYNGPITQLLEVNKRSMNWINSIDKGSNKKVQISLMRSLKSAWNFDPNEKSDDILEVYCRPDESLERFFTYYTRYHYDEKGWTSIRRGEPLFWEAEDGDHELGVSLPDIKKFP